MNQPFKNLEDTYRAEPRPVTALGRVVIGGLAALGLDGSRAKFSDSCERYWCNRPGQHQGENFAIAFLVTLTAHGLSAAWLWEWLAPSSIPGYLGLLVLIVPGFFALIHALIFAASGIEALARFAEITPYEPPGHFPGRLFLLLLTATCTANLFRSDTSLLSLLVSSAWCFLAIANFGALLLLCFRALRSALASHQT